MASRAPLIGMSDFATTLSIKLEAELGASEREARQIAEQAQRFRDDTEFDDTPAELIERMKKRKQDRVVEKWNNVIGFLDGGEWGIGDDGGGDSQYKL